MDRIIYPNPPIVEAVVQLGFVKEISSSELFDALKTRLAKRYPGKPQIQDLTEISANLTSDTVTTSTRRTPHMTFLTSSDGTRLLGCGTQRISVHVLAPYPGWERFIEQIDEAIGALPVGASSEGLATLAIRYIDRILLPADAQAFEDYVTILPDRPDAMPPTLRAFHFVNQTVDKEDGTVAQLTLASRSEGANGKPILLYDLSLEQTGAPLCGLTDRSWRPKLESMHERQRSIFEGSITDRMRELFQ